MLDFKKFLRFEISGYVAVLYAFLFCLAFYDLGKMKEMGLSTDINLLDYSVTGFILSAPIGFLMHQIDISLFSPFRKRRWFLFERKVIGLLEELFPKGQENLCDKKRQALLEWAVSQDQMSHLDEEIGNRYSYYYARMEAGLFAPVFGFLIFLGFQLYNCNAYSPPAAPTAAEQQVVFHCTTATVPICLFILLASTAILAYCPVIFWELNDLECLAVRVQKEVLAKVPTSSDSAVENDHPQAT